MRGHSEIRDADKGLGPLLVFGFLVMIACLGAAAPWSLAHGVLFIAIGLLMSLSSPTSTCPVHWTWLGGLWLMLSTLSHLPSTIFGGAPYFHQLHQAGIRISHAMSPHPADSALATSSMTAVGVIAIWALLHRVSGERRMRIAVVMMVSVTLLTTADWLLRTFGYNLANLSDFGFFPNRNHGATFVSMGVVVSFGALIQSLHQKRHGTSVFSLICLLWLTGSIILRSPSRSSLLLIPLAVMIWYWLVDRQRYLQGHIGKAALLLLAALILGFATTGGPLMQRLKWRSPPTMEEKNHSAVVSSKTNTDKPIDGRIGIGQDTLEMISNMPWTGCGAGQFSFVFPLFRNQSQDSRGSEVLHPESSWLWVAAECGVPACFALVALVLSVFIGSARSLKNDHGHFQALRAACLAAAGIPFLHAFFDVAPHRMGILWFAAVLVGLALPDQTGTPSIRARIGWRLAGISVAIWGAALLHGHLAGTPIPDREHSQRLTQSAYSTYLRETKAANVPDPKSEDPLETALRQLIMAVELNPMDSRAHGLLGMLALHFDDKDDLARKAFRAQLALNPRWVELPAIQGNAWAKINPNETAELWREALRRANLMAQVHPERDYHENLRRQFERTAGSDRELREAIRAAQDPTNP